MRESDRFTEQFFDVRNDPAQNPLQLNIHYPGTAKVIAKHFHGKKMLEVGCGMGWITSHLQAAGENASGFDISQYAVDNAVCPDLFQADMMDCVKWKKKWDVVFCVNSMCYLDEDEIPTAIKGLARIAKSHVFVVLQTWQNLMIRNGRVPPYYKFNRKWMGGFRKTGQTHDWWLEQFFDAGMDLDWELYKQIKFDDEGLPGEDFRTGGLGWRGLDSILVLKHQGE